MQENGFENVVWKTAASMARKQSLFHITLDISRYFVCFKYTEYITLLVVLCVQCVANITEDIAYSHHVQYGNCSAKAPE